MRDAPAHLVHPRHVGLVRRPPRHPEASDPVPRQISSLLSRPTIIDRSECQVGLPSLKLEGYSPSPLLHVKLQSELITQLSRRFGLPKNVVRPCDIREYQATVEAWMASLPASLALDKADESADVQRPWIVSHRHHTRTTSLSMLIEPFRAYLARPMTASSPDQLAIRRDGIDYSLRLMDALYAFFNHVYPGDARFHRVLFCIFDTAAVLCSALMHEEDCSAPRRDEAVEAVDGAVAMLRSLSNATQRAKTSYDILLRVSQRVTRRARPPFAPPVPGDARQGRNACVGGLATTPPPGRQAELGDAGPYALYGGTGPKSGMAGTGTSASPPDAMCAGAVPLVCTTSHGGMGVDGSVDMSTSPVGGLGVEYAHAAPYLDMTPPLEDTYQPVEFGNIAQQGAPGVHVELREPQPALYQPAGTGRLVQRQDGLGDEVRAGQGEDAAWWRYRGGKRGQGREKEGGVVYEI